LGEKKLKLEQAKKKQDQDSKVIERRLPENYKDDFLALLGFE
jgi:hypothetical protein